MNGDVSPSMISDKLILPSQLQCLEMSCQYVNIVQGNGNTVFSHLATLVHSKPAREGFIPSGRTPRIKGLKARRALQSIIVQLKSNSITCSVKKERKKKPAFFKSDKCSLIQEYL